MNANKPAFPAYDLAPSMCQNSHFGMSQRQFYKAAALTGLLSNPTYIGGALGVSTNTFARDAANVADALLSEDAEFEGRKK